MFVKEGLKKCGIFHTVDWTLPPPPYFIVKCGKKHWTQIAYFSGKWKAHKNIPKQRERERKKRERESSVNIPIIELQSTLSTSELLSCSVLSQHQNCWVAECSVNLPIDKLQSTLPTYWKWRYRVLTFLIIYLLCQHTKISVTECSVKCVVFELQSTLWAMVK